MMLLGRLAAYCSSQTCYSLVLWLTAAAIDLDELLVNYGQFCYAAGSSLHDFKETINAIVDIRPRLHRALPGAWDSAWEWRSRLPNANRIAIPVILLRAMASLALLWEWDVMAVMLFLGFLGMLRPFELLSLRHKDISYVDSSRGLSLLFIFIGRPKTRHLAARRQHVRVDDQEIIPFVKASLSGGLPEARIFDAPPAHFRALFSALVEFFGIDARHLVGVSPACLRPGGATWLYQETDSPEQVRFRGRWLSSRMLEIYIQEVAGSSLLNDLQLHEQSRIEQFASALLPLMLSRLNASKKPT